MNIKVNKKILNKKFLEQLKIDIANDSVLSTEEKTDAQTSIESLLNILPEDVWSVNHPFSKIFSFLGPNLFRFLVYFNKMLLKFKEVRHFKSKLKTFSNDKENFYSNLLELELAYEFSKSNRLQILEFDPNFSGLTPDFLMKKVSNNTEFIMEIKNISENNRVKKMKEDYSWLVSVLSEISMHFNIVGNLYNYLGNKERKEVKLWIDSIIQGLNSSPYKSKNLELKVSSLKERGIKAEFYKDDHIEHTLIRNINNKLTKYSVLLTNKRKLVIVVCDIQIFYYVKNNRLPIIKKIEDIIKENSNLLAVILYTYDFGYSKDKVIRSDIIGNHEMIVKSKEDYSMERFWIIGSKDSEGILSNSLK